MQEVYAKIRILERGIQELRNALLTISDTLPSSKGTKKDALIASRNTINEAISSLSEKRRNLILENACSIASISPISLP